MDDAIATTREAFGAYERERARLGAENDRLRGENRTLRECLEGMVWQFGHHFERDGQCYLGTRGMSDLEHAFAVLGLAEPQPYDPDEGLPRHSR